MAFMTLQGWQVSSGKNLNGVHLVQADAMAEAEWWYPTNPTDTYIVEVVVLREVED